MKSNEELINTIENIVAEIQAFDDGKNSYNNHSNEWKNRFDKLTNIVLDYVAINNKSYFDKVDNTTDNEKKSITAFKYNIELFRALKNAVENYNNSRGSFINYFSFIFKREIDKIKQKEYVDDMRAGIHLPDNKLRRIKKVKKLLVSSGKDIRNPNAVKWLAAQLKCPVDEIENLILIESQKKADLTVNDNDDDEVDLIESIKDEDNAIEKMINDSEKTEIGSQILGRIDNVKSNLSESYKAIITNKLVKSGFCKSQLEQYKFYSETEYNKCQNPNRSQKDVTDDYGLHKSTYNKVWSRIVNDIKK